MQRRGYQAAGRRADGRGHDRLMYIAMHALADCASTMYHDPSSLPAVPTLSKADCLEHIPHR